jgi:enediyne biosynthesis protein E4
VIVRWARPLLGALALSLPALPARGAPKENPARFRLLPAFVPYRNHSSDGNDTAITHMVGAGVCILDYDGDGLWDLLFPDRNIDGAGGGTKLFRGLGELRFQDVTSFAGIDDDGWSEGCAVADIDDDGDPDVYLTRIGRNDLFRNGGDGTFRPIAMPEEHPAWSTSAAFADLDLDGLVDLYVCNYIDLEKVDLRQRCLYFGIEVFCGPNGLPGTQDVLYRNRDGSSFEDVTATSGVASPDTRGFSVLMTDLDSDRLPEIHVADDAGIDLLFRNRGGFRFEDVSLVSGVGYSGLGMEQSGMGSAAGDVDGDGDEDLYVTNFQRDYNTLYRNDGALTFQDVTADAGLALPTLPHLAWGASFLDVGNDGALDLFVANGHIYPELENHTEVGEPYRQASQLFLGDGSGRFREVPSTDEPPLRLGRGTAVGDLNDDGGVDVVVSNLGGTPDLYLARDTKARWARLRLLGTTSNRDGLGAVVRAHVGSKTLTRVLRVSDGILGSNEPVVHLGLGKSETLEELDVLWPSGRVDHCENLPADTTQWIKEGIGCLN